MLGAHSANLNMSFSFVFRPILTTDAQSDAKKGFQHELKIDLKSYLQIDLQNDLKKDLKMEVFLKESWQSMAP